MHSAQLGSATSRRLLGQRTPLSRAERSAIASADLNESLKLIVRSLEPEARERRASILLDLGKGIPRGPYGCLAEAFAHLVRNAIESLDFGGSVTIETTHDASGIRVRIIDTGAGMSEDTLAHALDPFFSTKRNGRALGIGLTVASALIEKQHGRLLLSSQAGEGATVTIILPVRTTHRRPLVPSPC